VVEKLVRDAEGVCLDFERIRFQTKGINFFPNQRNPRVIFLDLREFGENSKRLAERIEEIAEKYEFEKEKPFVPHVTLGRFRKGASQKVEGLKVEVANFEIEFNSFCLMKSELSSSGSRYYVVKEFEFGEGDPPLRSE